MTPVSDGPECTFAVSNVCQHVRVLENRDCGLRIQEYPAWVNTAIVGLREHESVLRESSARHSRRTVALAGIVPVALTSPALRDAGMNHSIRARN